MFKKIVVIFPVLYSYCTILFSYEVVKLTQVSADRANWSLEVAKMVNEYFSRPYKDTDKNDPFYSLPCSDGTEVFRPNHSLAHGLRQAYLASDIVLFFRQADGSAFTNKVEGEKFVAWIKNKLNIDQKFLQKVEMANAFQRTGRQSELSRRQNEQKYEAYLLADQDNFSDKAKDYIGLGKLFEDEKEADIFKQAIVKKFSIKTPDISDDLYFLSKIFFSAHLFDLRRLPHFDKSQLYQEIAMQLFGTQNPNNKEKELFDQLWVRAGDYLNATGDRDMENSLKNNWNPEIFCSQAHNPQKLVKALQLAKTKPEEKLLSSIVGHAQVMRELKERRGKVAKPPKKGKELRENLENAPYTASEGYLKILLGEKFIEIPSSATEDEARKFTRLNVEAFLAEKKRVVKDLTSKTEIFLPRVENPDEYYINTLINAMMEERKHRGKIVFYHTTEPETGFLYDVYTELRNQLQIAGGDEIRALRAIDKEFIQLNEEVQKNQSQDSAKEKATVVDFMAKLKGVADSDDVYRTMGLSTNFSLFGSDQQKWADSYNLFYLVKDERVASQPLQNDIFFAYIEQYTGIPMDYSQYKKILDRYILTCNSNKPCRNGRLIQIFVDPAVLNDMAYFSVLLGAPVLKDDSTPAIDIPITLLRTNPHLLLDYLVGTKGAVVQNVVPDLLRPGQLKLHDLQARLFIRPDLMFDPQLITIKSYFRFDLSDKVTAYKNDIKALVNQNLISWLKLGAPSDPDAFEKGLVNLKRLVQEVYQGSTGKAMPIAEPISLPDQLVKLLLSGRKEQAARLFEENYDTLKDERFVIPKDQSGRGGGISTLAKLYRFLPFGHLFKIAFSKGLYPGKEPAYEVISLLTDALSYDDLIQLLLKLKDPAKTCELFLKHFKGRVKNVDIIKLIELIDLMGNKEEILEEARPLFQLFNYKLSDRVLKGVWNIPQDDRKKIIEETLSIIDEPSLSELYIADIMAKVYDLRKLSDERKNLIWSVTKQLDKTWEKRLYLIEAVRATNDIPLAEIDTQLKSHLEGYSEKINNDFETKAFEVIFSSLMKLFNIGTIEMHDIVKDFWPKHLLKNLSDDIFFLIKNSEQNLIDTAKTNDDIAWAIWRLIKNVQSLEKHDLILTITKKIIEEKRDWSFGLQALERLQGFDLEILKDLSSNEITQIINTLLTKTLWKEDDFTHPSHRFYKISAPFTYDDILRHAKTRPESYNIEFLESKEGIALVNTFITQLNQGLVPASNCRYIANAYDRSTPTAAYNKSLIADCVSQLAEKE